MGKELSVVTILDYDMKNKRTHFINQARLQNERLYLYH